MSEAEAEVLERVSVLARRLKENEGCTEELEELHDIYQEHEEIHDDIGEILVESGAIDTLSGFTRGDYLHEKVRAAELLSICDWWESLSPLLDLKDEKLVRPKLDFDISEVEESLKQRAISRIKRYKESGDVDIDIERWREILLELLLVEADVLEDVPESVARSVVCFKREGAEKYTDSVENLVEASRASAEDLVRTMTKVADKSGKDTLAYKTLEEMAEENLDVSTIVMEDIFEDLDVGSPDDLASALQGTHGDLLKSILDNPPEEVLRYLPEGAVPIRWDEDLGEDIRRILLKNARYNSGPLATGLTKEQLKDLDSDLTESGKSEWSSDFLSYFVIVHPMTSDYFLEKAIDTREETGDWGRYYELLYKSAETPADSLTRVSSFMLSEVADSCDLPTDEDRELLYRLSKKGLVGVEGVRYLIALLDSDDADVRRHACNWLGQSPVYPPPSQLEEALEDVNDGVSRAAERALERLEKKGGGKRPEDLELDDDVSLIKRSIEDGKGLKKRTDEGFWEQPEIQGIEADIYIEAVNKVGSAGKHVVLYPGYEPEASLMLAVALIAEIEGDVLFYSPGGRNHWGLKGDIREEYRKYGISGDSGETTMATPFPEIHPHAYVSQGKIKTGSGNSGLHGNETKLVLTKKESEVSIVEDKIGAAIVNLTAKSPQDVGKLLEELDSSDTPVFVLYSPYTEHESDRGPARYGAPRDLHDVDILPGRDSLDDAIKRTEGGETGFESGRISSDFSAMISGQRIEVRSIDEGGLLDEIDGVLEEFFGLMDDGLDGPGYKVLSELLFLERLPVPVEEYDEWIMKEHRKAETPPQYIPSNSKNRLSSLENYGEEVDDRRAPTRVFDAVKRLRRMREILSDDNPMFDEICSEIERALSEERRIVVFCPKVSLTDILKDTLEESERVPEGAIGDQVLLMTPADARDMPQVDRLIFVGPQRRQYSGFYMHPRAEEVVVMTYGFGWVNMMERQVEGYVDELNQAFGREGYAPYQTPVFDLPEDADMDGESVEEESEEKKAYEHSYSFSESSGDTAPGGVSEAAEDVDSRVEAAQMLERAFEEATSDDSSSYGGSVGPRYQIETASGQILKTGDVILDRGEEVESGERYVYSDPERLEAGDRILDVPDEIEQRIWMERMSEVYDEDVWNKDATEGLKTWYHSVQNIIDDLAGDGETAALRKAEKVASREEFDRRPSTLRGWFADVSQADKPLDLVTDPSLTIGPRRAEDVKTVGEIFDDEELMAHYQEIEESMRAVRSLNRNEGREFRQDLIEKLNSDVSGAVETEEYVVEAVEQITDG